MGTVRTTSCNRDCPDTCALELHLDNAGRPVSLRGVRDDPITRGFLCERTSRFLARQQAPERFTTPMRRVDGRLVPIGWDAALELAASTLRRIRSESGPEAILHYRSGGSLGMLTALADVLFAHFGPVTGKSGDICSGAGEAAQEDDFGVCDSHDLSDLLNSRTIVVWGKNPHTSGVHLLPVLREAKANGATIVGVDPVRTRLAELCDAFVRPRPGGDHALAFGVARLLFERGATDPRGLAACAHVDGFRALAFEHDVDGWARRADVPVSDVERLARAFVERPTALLVGWGLGRRRNGSRTVRALDALAAISGNLGVPGGGASFYFQRRAAFDLDVFRALPDAPRKVREACFGPEVLALRDPPLRAAWITAGNPASMLPDSATVRRALSGLEFVVVVDTHPTDTTDVADLVLPTLTLLEDSDVLGAYGNHWVRESRPVLAPPLFPQDADVVDVASRAPRFAERFVGSPGPRHELEILQGLAARLGLSDVLSGSVDDWKRRLTASLGRSGAPLEALPARDPRRPKVLFADLVFATPSGKVELLHEAVDDAPATSADFPLLLTAVSTPAAQASQHSLPRDGRAPRVVVHPDASAGIADGGDGRLVSRLGALDVRVVHDPAARRDVALMEKGGMARDGGCPNDILPAVETDAGGGAAYYDEPVRLEPR
ncbi:MAG: molybdopterin-dependent oxidoreductase [Planctomycetes bacterium]|nr:molybdopterin-dependent oxidoreductase [Planctomycetota bacterium]